MPFRVSTGRIVLVGVAVIGVAGTTSLSATLAARAVTRHTSASAGPSTGGPSTGGPSMGGPSTGSPSTAGQAAGGSGGGPTSLLGPDPATDGQVASVTSVSPGDLPPAPTQGVRPGAPSSPDGASAYTVPARVLAAYRQAASALASSRPHCHLSWYLLAALGRIESNNADGGAVTASGTASPPIFGPVLDGQHGTVAIHDTDHGRWDRNSRWDRAVGPMQFIPSTWRVWGVSLRTGGVADPQNVGDAAVTAGRYLCADGRDLATSRGLRAAVLSYNDSSAYLSDVLGWVAAYQRAYR